MFCNDTPRGVPFQIFTGINTCNPILQKQEYAEFKNTFQRWIDTKNRPLLPSSIFHSVIIPRRAIPKRMLLDKMTEILNNIQQNLDSIKIEANGKSWSQSMQYAIDNDDDDTYDLLFRKFHRIICPKQYTLGGRIKNKTRRRRSKSRRRTRPLNKKSP